MTIGIVVAVFVSLIVVLVAFVLGVCLGISLQQRVSTKASTRSALPSAAHPPLPVRSHRRIDFDGSSNTTPLRPAAVQRRSVNPTRAPIQANSSFSSLGKKELEELLHMVQSGKLPPATVRRAIPNPIPAARHQPVLTFKDQIESALS